VKSYRSSVHPLLPHNSPSITIEPAEASAFPCVTRSSSANGSLNDQRRPIPHFSKSPILNSHVLEHLESPRVLARPSSLRYCGNQVAQRQISSPRREARGKRGSLSLSACCSVGGLAWQTSIVGPALAVPDSPTTFMIPYFFDPIHTTRFAANMDLTHSTLHCIGGLSA
jgi:hypothetical protein